MRTVGHHTCKKDGGKEFVLNNAPFISPKTDRIPFLGVGYYFWDYDLEQAKKWGVNHYNNSFYIIEAELDIPDAVFLDLAGNRQQMEYFVSLLQRFQKRGAHAQKWKFGEFIEFLKEFRKADYQAFPFEIIRAQDFLEPKEKDKIKFNHLQNFTNLNPRFVICLFTNSELYLQNKRVAFER